MKDFNYYSNVEAIRPTKKQYTTTFVYDNGETIEELQGTWSLTDLETKYPKTAICQVVVDQVQYKKAIDEYAVEHNRLMDEFKNDCRSDMGCDHMSPELWNCIYNNAWDDGHSYGLQEVYNNLDKYVDLANLAIDSIKKNLY